VSRYTTYTALPRSNPSQAKRGPSRRINICTVRASIGARHVGDHVSTLRTPNRPSEADHRARKLGRCTSARGSCATGGATRGVARSEARQRFQAYGRRSSTHSTSEHMEARYGRCSTIVICRIGWARPAENASGTSSWVIATSNSGPAYSRSSPPEPQPGNRDASCRTRRTTGVSLLPRTRSCGLADNRPAANRELAIQTPRAQRSARAGNRRDHTSRRQDHRRRSTSARPCQ
jgi:hypothetical protein